MSWSNLPCDETVDWSELAFIRQFAEAFNERREHAQVGVDPGTSRPSSVSVPQSGTDLQSATRWRELQEAIELIAPFYVPPRDPFKDISSVDPPGLSDDYDTDWARIHLANFYTAESLWLEAGLTSGGWRRTTVHPSDPAFTDFGTGRMQAGDIIGPWIFNDLYATLALLTTKIFVGEGTSEGSEADTGVGGDDYDDRYALFVSLWDEPASSLNAKMLRQSYFVNYPFGGTSQVSVNGAKRVRPSLSFPVGTTDLTGGARLYVHAYHSHSGNTSNYYDHSELGLAEDEIRDLGEPDLSSGTLDRSADVAHETPPPQLPDNPGGTIGYRQTLTYLGVADMEAAGFFDYGADD